MQDATGSTTYHYDALGRLVREERSQNDISFVTRYGYNDNSELTSITYPSGRILTYLRNSIGAVTKVTTTFEGETSVVADTISRLPFGPITTMALGNGLALTNEFDQLYRLTGSVAGELYNRSYDHYATGNIKTITDNIEAAATQNFIYDDLGRLTGATGKYGELSYQYDAIDNRVSSSENGLLTTYG